MKSLRVTLGIAVLAASILAACSNGSSGAADPNAPATADERSSLEREFQSGLDRMHAELDRLKERAQTASGELKSQLEQAQRQLEAQEPIVRAKYEALKRGSAAAWSDVRDGFRQAASELQRSLDEARKATAPTTEEQH